MKNAGDNYCRLTIVGIAGGTASGKTELSRQLQRKLGTDQVVILPHDAYYRDLAHLSHAELSNWNFDHPDAFDTSLLIDHLHALCAGKAIEVPNYDFVTHCRVGGVPLQCVAGLVIVEGILVLFDQNLRELFHMTVFVEAVETVRLERRLKRDVIERGRDVQSILDQYNNSVLPMHNMYVEPSKEYADLIIDGTISLDENAEFIVGRLTAR